MSKNWREASEDLRILAPRGSARSKRNKNIVTHDRNGNVSKKPGGRAEAVEKKSLEALQLQRVHEDRLQKGEGTVRDYC